MRFPLFRLCSRIQLTCTALDKSNLLIYPALSCCEHLDSQQHAFNVVDAIFTLCRVLNLPDSSWLKRGHRAHGVDRNI